MWCDWYSLLMYGREREKELLREADRNRIVFLEKRGGPRAAAIPRRLAHGMGRLMMSWGEALDRMSGLHCGEDRTPIGEVASSKYRNSPVRRNCVTHSSTASGI
jgi:hypothetical protein